MFILKSDYLDLGISEEVLSFVAEDAEGYIQHDPLQAIGEAGSQTTLFAEVAKLLNLTETIIFGKSAFPNPEVGSWFLEKEDLTHTWKNKKI